MKVIKILEKIEEKILIFSFMFSVALVFLQIIMRYVFSNSLSWSEELARYLFLWQVWIGTSYAISENKHLKIEALTDRMKGKIKKIVKILASSLWLIFCIFLTFKGIELVYKIYAQGQSSPAMAIPMAYAYACVPIGGFLMSIKLMYGIFGITQNIEEEEGK